MPRYGARNQWIGRVTSIKKGAVMAQVTVEIAPSISVCSVMTMDSVRDLGLKRGAKVRALIKAVHVLLATAE